MRKRRYAQAFKDAGMEREASALFDCQETELKAFCRNCGKAWWVINRCRTRICPLCSWQKAKERAAFLEAMSAGMKHPKMITVTMPTWTASPADGIRFIRRAFARLRRSALFKEVAGGAYQIELKPKEHGWHIHIHALLEAPFIPYQRLFSTWARILDRSHVEVDIRAATTPKEREYVCKYAAKSASFDAEIDTVVAWYKATKGQRLFGTFGKWYNATVESLNPELAKSEPPPSCPFCHAVKSVVLARDGPFLFEKEVWHKIAQTILDDEGDWRPLTAVKEILDGGKPCNPTNKTNSTKPPSLS
jgi:hypothetical protein